jgi:hypothetical protein
MQIRILKPLFRNYNRPLPGTGYNRSVFGRLCKTGIVVKTALQGNIGKCQTVVRMSTKARCRRCCIYT